MARSKAYVLTTEEEEQERKGGWETGVGLGIGVKSKSLISFVFLQSSLTFGKAFDETTLVSS